MAPSPKINVSFRAAAFRAAVGSLREVVRGAIGASLFSVFILTSSAAWGQSNEETEYRVKLAFLYNFAQFVQWPADAFHGANSPLILCVAGQDPFKGGIEADLHGRTVGGHPIRIKRLMQDEDPRACHMIFVRASEKKLAGNILQALKKSNTLTIGETKGFADLGGLINLTVEENKLRFEINLDAALQTKLKISSKLLALARIVKVENNP